MRPHRPEGLVDEIEQAGFQNVAVFGVEGPGWLVSDFEERWADTFWRKEILDLARLLESDASIVGMSAHLLGTGRK